jgi:hypothetical protein
MYPIEEQVISKYDHHLGLLYTALPRQGYEARQDEEK